jgi:hypothetical protein
MAATSIIAPNKTAIALSSTNSVTDTQRKVKLCFGSVQKNSNLKLMNNFKNIEK